MVGAGESEERGHLQGENGSIWEASVKSWGWDRLLGALCPEENRKQKIPLCNILRAGLRAVYQVSGTVHVVQLVLTPRDVSGAGLHVLQAPGGTSGGSSCVTYWVSGSDCGRYQRMLIGNDSKLHCSSFHPGGARFPFNLCHLGESVCLSGTRMESGVVEWQPPLHVKYMSSFAAE